MERVQKTRKTRKQIPLILGILALLLVLVVTGVTTTIVLLSSTVQKQNGSTSAVEPHTTDCGECFPFTWSLLEQTFTCI